MTTTEKIHFTKEKETLLMTLTCRAVHSQSKNPILRDPWAEEVMRRIDYDMSSMAWRMAQTDSSSTLVATRAATFDLLTTDYLAEHPDATVLHLGCGLDSRAFRVDPPDSVRWFDVDYLDVIDLRRQLFLERPAYSLIGSPLEDLRWLEEVPRGGCLLLIAEGVFPYLREADVKALLNAVTDRFSGGKMVFDACSRAAVKRFGSNVGGTGATYKWGLDDPLDIRQLEPKLALIKEYRTSELTGFFRLPWWARALYRSMDASTALRRMIRILVYQF